MGMCQLGTLHLPPMTRCHVRSLVGGRWGFCLQTPNRPHTPPLPGDTGLCPPVAISLRALTEELLIHKYSLSFKVTRRKIKLTGVMGHVLPYFTNSKTFRNQRQHKHKKNLCCPFLTRLVPFAPLFYL